MADPLDKGLLASPSSTFTTIALNQSRARAPGRHLLEPARDPPLCCPGWRGPIPRGPAHQPHARPLLSDRSLAAPLSGRICRGRALPCLRPPLYDRAAAVTAPLSTPSSSRRRTIAAQCPFRLRLHTRNRQGERSRTLAIPPLCRLAAGTRDAACEEARALRAERGVLNAAAAGRETPDADQERVATASYKLKEGASRASRLPRVLGARRCVTARIVTPLPVSRRAPADNGLSCLTMNRQCACAARGPLGGHVCCEEAALSPLHPVSLGAAPGVRRWGRARARIRGLSAFKGPS
ncbi:hypothetical protein NDU88_000727 [Pleurodeles waltl]|uniref:Uncharacterized protein n=1 Tax=Pleurodeles waltl TaxID=8319 RepID=A0AAV7R5S0_PLEWA|nr:hypothetical protein NDU88_000727 [Pleurodeles waltl]